jgi:hypothetical protein
MPPSYTVSVFFSRAPKTSSNHGTQQLEYRVEAVFTPGDPSQIEYARVARLKNSQEQPCSLTRFLESLSDTEENQLQEYLALAGIEQETGQVDYVSRATNK